MAAILGFVLVALLGAAWPGSASAEVPVKRFNVLPSTTQAGGHPDLAATFVMGTRGNDPEKGCCADAKDITVSAPAGVIINPNATPQCTQAQFAIELCPADSQVGLAQLALFDGGVFFATLALYNLVPRPGEPGSFGFQIPIFRNAQFVVAKPRTGDDFGLDIFSPAISHFITLSGVRILTWAVSRRPQT